MKGLFQKWGGWANPGSRGTSRGEADSGSSAFRPETRFHVLFMVNCDSACELAGNAYDFHLVQVRPAMISRLGSFVLSRISITTQLVIWFLFLSLVPCVVVTFIISFISNDSLKKTVRQGLLAISDAKTNQLETFIRERRGDLNMASRYPALVDTLPKLKQLRRTEPIDSPAYRKLARTVRPFMTNFVDSFGYSNAFLFDTDGTTLFQLKPELAVGANLLTGDLKKSELAEVFDRVRTSCCRLRFLITNYTRDGASRRHSSPVRCLTRKAWLLGL